MPGATAGCLHHPEDLRLDGEILLHRLAVDAHHRLHRRLFPRLSRSHRDHADGALSRLHDSVLDVERDPDDLVDSAARPQRAREPRAYARPPRRQAGRMASLFAVLGGARLHPPLHVLHGGADLQFDDAHRSAAHRGGLRFRRLRVADAVEPHRSALEARHRHRLDLRRHHRDGGFHHVRRDGRRTDRLRRQGRGDAAERPAVPACGGERGHSAWPSRCSSSSASTASSTCAKSSEMGEGRSPAFYWLAAFFAALRAVSLRPDDRHLHPFVPGSDRRPDLPFERPFLPLVRTALAWAAASSTSATPSSARSSSA